MARPRKAWQVIEAEGKSHRTKAEMNERKEKELDVIADDIKPPSFLNASQKKQFNWYVEQLSLLNIIGNLDTELLARYVVSQDQYERIIAKMAKLDPVDDIEIFAKLTTAQNKLFVQCRQAGNDLGLSITSRGKLVVPKLNEEEKELTPEERLFGNSL